MKKQTLILLVITMAVMPLLLCRCNSGGRDAKVMKPAHVGEEIDFRKDVEAFAEFKKLQSKVENEEQLSEEEEKRIEYLCENFGCDYRSDWEDPFGEACSWFCCGVIKGAYSSSELASTGNISYKAENVLYTYGHAWVEGVKGYGIGESITIVFDSTSTQPDKIEIINGYAKTPEAYKNNSRVKTLRLYNMGKFVADLELEDKLAYQTFDIGFLLGEQGKEWELKFEIVDVYKGDKYDDTAITLITFDGPCH